MIIFDPPAFSTTKKSRFSTQGGTAKLTAALLPLLENDGLLVSSSNHQKVSMEDYMKELRKGALNAGDGGDYHFDRRPAGGFPLSGRFSRRTLPEIRDQRKTVKRKFLRNIRLWWLLLAGLLFAALLVWQLTRWAYNTALDDLVETSGERLTLYAGTLRGALNQYAYLPYILSRQADVRILLKSSFNAELVNRYLEALDRQAGSEALYVMNAVGDTLAASNWRDTQSFVGRNYGFRPYFTDAKAGKKGQQFGVGATTGIPGYFMSHPVVENGKFLGATVVKVDLTPLQEGWREGGETVMVSDANGVLFLSSRDDWRYKTLAPLSEAPENPDDGGTEVRTMGP